MLTPSLVFAYWIRGSAMRLLLELPGAAVLEGAQDAPRDDHAVHFVRAVVDAGGARVAVHLRERRVFGDAQGAVHLDRTVDDVVERRRPPELDERDLHTGLVALVDLVRGVHGEQAGRLDL